MYRLRDLKNGFYQIHCKNGKAFEGTPKSLFDKALEMGVYQQDLLIAVQTMMKLSHDFADFNEQGRLKYTRKNGG